MSNAYKVVDYLREYGTQAYVVVGRLSYPTYRKCVGNERYIRSK